MSKLDCVFTGSNHSDDRIKVYFGADDPIIVCGYHEQRFRPDEVIHNPKAPASSESPQPGEGVREFYRRQGEARAIERVVTILKQQPFYWAGDRQTLTISKAALIELIQDSANGMVMAGEIVLQDGADG